MSLARASLAELSGFIEGLAQVPRTPGALQDFLREVRLRARRIRDIGWNIAVLAACKGSQDARDPLAKQVASRARALNADLFKTLAPIEDLMLGLPAPEFEQLMADPCSGRRGTGCATSVACRISGCRWRRSSWSSALAPTACTPGATSTTIWWAR
jgi:oligoendopeptidase F